MGLKTENVSPNIPKDKKLWRYMSLDKLINLLDTKRLFFTPISSYANSDPFEGLLPKVALDAISESSLGTYHSMLENRKKLRELILEKDPNFEENSPEISKKLLEFEESLENHLPKVEQSFFNVMNSIVVNCWHQNDDESEAMWRLYSDTNKGVAIQTTLEALTNSITDTKKDRIYFTEIKYIDFNDTTLKPSDCVVNRNIGPLLKRTAFSHEKEARLFFVPEKDYLNPETSKPAHELVDIDLDTLIEKVYISPYASEPFPSSVECILKMFGLPDSKIVRSKLLTPNQNLLKLF